MAARLLGCVWLTAVFLRFFWVFLPQTGYIHPDEFFQATEITAGDIFKLKHTRTWEFQEEFPVRSAAFPYAFTGLPLYILKTFLDVEATTSKSIIVAPRLFISGASLIIDLSVYVICRNLRTDPVPSLFLLGTSFVTLVFYTRTFSNTAEAIFFASLLLLVVLSLAKRSALCTRKDQARYFLIGTVVGVGIWIRPTFLAFACVPLCWCLLDVCLLRWSIDKMISKLVTNVMKYCIWLGLGGALTIVSLVVLDSHYFGYLQRRKFVLTPLNFFLYNMDTSSLKQHGLHPRITHFAVNMPLLFGPLALVLYVYAVYATMKRKFLVPMMFLQTANDKKDNTSNAMRAYFILKMLLFSILVPVVLLSLIPHQEARFITPVLVPLVVVFSQISSSSSVTPLILLCWCIWNVFGCVMFGILHQGGVYPCLAHLQRHLHFTRINTLSTSFHVTFYHTYMPPQHLLAWPKLAYSSHKGMYHNLALYDLKGASRDELYKHLTINLEKTEARGMKKE
ncbi:GPI mannosyltransferase 4-like isoform X2 [Stylophora pistillata]|nr:GPI mannosyltransferase 4-like isoform X2 [Stylophora pistillata]